MSRSKIILIVFILLAILQLYVPAKMILNQEDVLTSGNEFKFRCAPVDPGDPFRGKYVTLHFKENSFPVTDDSSWVRDEIIYVILEQDSNGFAKMQSVVKEPEGISDYVTAKVSYVANINNSGKKLFISYPFNRFYVDESKAPEIEAKYGKSLSDSTKVTYALVSVKDGEGVIKDIFVDNVSVTE